MDANCYERIEQVARFLLDRTKHRPVIGIICGSGLGGLADLLEEKDVFSYQNIPHFPVSTVAGHSGSLVFGTYRKRAVVIMRGRFHVYEGYKPGECAMPVRVMKMLGIRLLIVTNAAGAVNERYNVGDLMIIKDHINLPGFVGVHPLSGPNDERWGKRFIPLSDAYTRSLRTLAKKVADDLGFGSSVHEGVYCMLTGPTYETVAEVKYLRSLGADTVGMSTVHEIIYAVHCGLQVLAISLITNKCVADYDTERKANHEEVLREATKRSPDLLRIVQEFIAAYDPRTEQEKAQNAAADANTQLSPHKK